MELDLWVTGAGQAKIAASRSLTDYDVGISSKGLNMESQGWIKIRTLIILESELPDRKTCIQATLSRLEEQEHQLREKLNEDLARIEQMRSEVLALEMSPAPVVTKSQPFEEADDDIPF